VGLLRSRACKTSTARRARCVSTRGAPSSTQADLEGATRVATREWRTLAESTRATPEFPTPEFPTPEFPTPELPTLGLPTLELQTLELPTCGTNVTGTN
jgi:hypothetical protein